MDDNSVMKIVGNAVVSTTMYNRAKELTVPNGITEIGVGAFYNCTYALELVTLPATVTKIGDKAFFGCQGLKKVDIPAAVTEIGEWAFGGTALREAVIPHGVTRIEQYTFCGSSLRRVTIPDTVEFIGKLAFEHTFLESVFIPASVKTIERDAFKRCPNLTIYCEGEPTDGWEELTETVEEREYVTTAEDDAFNFHRSGGGFTSHAVTTRKQVEVSWNPDARPVRTGVTREQYLKAVSSDLN